MSTPQKVLVTGGSGFIGTNFILHLRKLGCAIASLDRLAPLCLDPEVMNRIGDVTNRDFLVSVLNEFRPDAIVHLASRTDLDSDHVDDYAENIHGVRALTAAMDTVNSRAKLLVASSMLVHQLGRKPHSATDYTATTAYGKSKVEVERIISARSDLHWIIVRPTTIWGPWHYRWASGFVRRIALARYWHPSRSPCHRSYGFVGNVCHQLSTFLAAEREQVGHRIFYVGDPPLVLDDFVDAFHIEYHGTRCPRLPKRLFSMVGYVGDRLKSLGMRFPITSYRLENMTSDNIIDMSDTQRLCGDGPTDLISGVRLTRAWFDSHRSGGKITKDNKA